MYEDVLEEMMKMQEKINKLFNSFVTRDLFPSYRILNEKMKGFLRPLSDIIETDKEIIAIIDLPGVSKKDIDIIITDSGMEITAKKKTEKKVAKKNLKKYERKYMGFSRFFSLPRSADIKNIKATYRDGILEITIPKNKLKIRKKKKIKIKILSNQKKIKH